MSEQKTKLFTRNKNIVSDLNMEKICYLFSIFQQICLAKNCEVRFYLIFFQIFQKFMQMIFPKNLVIDIKIKHSPFSIDPLHKFSIKKYLFNNI